MDKASRSDGFANEAILFYIEVGFHTRTQRKYYRA
jgi:hypothetical protein